MYLVIRFISRHCTAHIGLRSGAHGRGGLRRRCRL